MTRKTCNHTCTSAPWQSIAMCPRRALPRTMRPREKKGKSCRSWHMRSWSRALSTKLPWHAACNECTDSPTADSKCVLTGCIHLSFYRQQASVPDGCTGCMMPNPGRTPQHACLLPPASATRRSCTSWARTTCCSRPPPPRWTRCLA